MVRQALVRDGSLLLSIDERLLDAARQWMPSLPVSVESEHPQRAGILVDIGDGVQRPHFAHGKPDLRLGATECWTETGKDRAFVQNDERTIAASLDLKLRIAQVVAASSAVEAHDMTSALTLISALLLLRDGRTPVHAGGVVDPRTDGVWLLLGDSHSGKSTTTANLVKGGWSYLSDDYVVIRQAAGGIEAEGWPEDFHVDEGYARGESTGTRTTLAESSLRGDARKECGMLSGLLFTRIVPGEPTAIAPVDASTALERLIRQTPWLMADPPSAPALLSLLSSASSLPAGEIQLGLDTYRDAELLAEIVSDFAGRSGRAHE